MPSVDICLKPTSFLQKGDVRLYDPTKCPFVDTDLIHRRNVRNQVANRQRPLVARAAWRRRR